MGLTLRALPGEYLVNLRNGTDETARTVADLDEAIAVGETLAGRASALPSDGGRPRRHPLSSAKRYRRRFIRRHNKWFRKRSLRRRRRN